VRGTDRPATGRDREASSGLEATDVRAIVTKHSISLALGRIRKSAANAVDTALASVNEDLTGRRLRPSGRSELCAAVAPS